MKTQVSAFGFEVLVTYLLPGILATIAVLVAHGVALEEAQFLASFVMLSLFTLFGALIASLQAVLESWILNWLTPRLMSKEDDQFDKEWDYYISNLPTNAYISRVVLFFQFETRLGLASIILGATLFSLSVLHAVILIVTGVVFYWIGVSHHKELGLIRESFYRAKD